MAVVPAIIDLVSGEYMHLRTNRLFMNKQRSKAGAFALDPINKITATSCAPMVFKQCAFFTHARY